MKGASSKRANYAYPLVKPAESRWQAGNVLGEGEQHPVYAVLYHYDNGRCLSLFVQKY